MSKLANKLREEIGVISLNRIHPCRIKLVKEVSDDRGEGDTTFSAQHWKGLS